MNGNEYLKYRREKSGYSVRKFAAEVDISPRTITYYEAGEKSICAIPLNKCINMFEKLGISVYEYFNTYYPYKALVDEKMREWNRNNPQNYNYGTIKKRLYLRIAQIKKRERIEESTLEDITEMYDSFFKNPSYAYLSDDNITKTDYEVCIKPIYYKIKIEMNGLPAERIERSIVDAIYKTDYTISDLAQMCDVSKQHLRQCIKGIYDLNSMHVYTALKLSYLLGLNFEETFVKKSIKN